MYVFRATFIIKSTSDVAWYGTYRVVQLNFTLEIEVFYMLFEKDHSIFSMTSLRQHIKYFNFQSKIQLDHPVPDKQLEMD